MPTRAEFEAAAQQFAAAASGASRLTAAIQAVDIGSALRGGSLSAAVSATVGESASAAAGCAARLGAMAQTCTTRAGIIARYEAELEIYELNLATYRRDLQIWTDGYERWRSAPDLFPHPGPEPTPPPKPVPPPDWADVPRP